LAVVVAAVVLLALAGDETAVVGHREWAIQSYMMAWVNATL